MTALRVGMTEDVVLKILGPPVATQIADTDRGHGLHRELILDYTPSLLSTFRMSVHFEDGKLGLAFIDRRSSPYAAMETLYAVDERGVREKPEFRSLFKCSREQR
jgi:hypothetical protein